MAKLILAIFAFGAALGIGLILVLTGHAGEPGRQFSRWAVEQASKRFSSPYTDELFSRISPEGTCIPASYDFGSKRLLPNGGSRITFGVPFVLGKAGAVICRPADAEAPIFLVGTPTQGKIVLEKSHGEAMKLVVEEGSLVASSRKLGLQWKLPHVTVHMRSEGEVSVYLGLNLAQPFLHLEKGSLIVSRSFAVDSPASQVPIKLLLARQAEGIRLEGKETVEMKQGASGTWLPSGFHQEEARSPPGPN